jgi:CRP-like cAMP-binding protein
VIPVTPIPLVHGQYGEKEFPVMHDSEGNLDSPRLSIRSVLAGNKPSPDLMSRFTEQAQVLLYSRGQILFQMGEAAKSVYLILNGEADLVMPLSNGLTIEFRADCGSLIGLPAAFSDEPYSMTAVASGDVEVALMGSEEFRCLVASQPAFSMDVLKILAAETRAARNAIRMLA